MATNTTEPAEVFAVDFAALAREIAMDIFPVETILSLHHLDDAEWLRIQKNPRFQSMLEQMLRDWNSAMNTSERVKIKAATGLESILENYIRDIGDGSIPLGQRVEAGKFLARLGELDGSKLAGGQVGGGFQIVLNIGTVQRTVDVPVEVGRVIEHEDA